MSVENAKKFIQEKSDKASVAEKVKAAKTENKSPEDVIVEIAAEEGYDFTAPELKQALAELSEGELDLEELDSVAGGWCKDIAKDICGSLANLYGVI